MKTVFTAENLSKKYGPISALFLPSLSVEQGELIALTGRNGSGKSTLLRLLAFLEQPSSGSLVYHGDVKNCRREITLLLQESYLMKCSVMDNVTLGLRLRGINQDLSAKFHNAMIDVGFQNPEQMASRPPSALSGGEKQRVALASRIILKPKVLLLDEPTSHVDAFSEKCILSTIENSLAQGCTVICATHSKEILNFLVPREVMLINHFS